MMSVWAMVMTVTPLRSDKFRLCTIIIMRQADLVELIGHLLERTIFLEGIVAKCDIWVEDSIC